MRVKNHSCLTQQIYNLQTIIIINILQNSIMFSLKISHN